MSRGRLGLKAIIALIILAITPAGMAVSNSSQGVKKISPISASNAIVYVPLGNAQTTQAFFTLQNNLPTAVSVIRVSSPHVKKIELVPAAINVPGGENPWLIAAGKSLVLAPGHQYLLLSGLKTALATGDELHLEVSLSSGEKMVIIAQAKSAFDQIHSH